jgi:aminopeptidase 2
MQSQYNNQRQLASHTTTDDFRLPTSIKPIHYDLILEPHFEEATYTGQVIIQLRVLKEVDQVTLHSEDLNITAALIQDLSGK